MSISSTILVASAKISSPCSLIIFSMASICGRFEIEATTSPVLSITASQIPMPSGTTAIYLVSTLWFCSLRRTSAPCAVLSTMLTNRGRSSTFAMSSATFRPTPPWTISTRPALRPVGINAPSGKPLKSTNTFPTTTIGMLPSPQLSAKTLPAAKPGDRLCRRDPLF